MTSDSSDELRFRYGRAAVIGALALAMGVLTLAWLNGRRTASRTEAVRQQLCGQIPAVTRNELDRLASSEEIAHSDFRNLNQMLEGWLETEVQLLREVDDNWAESAREDQTGASWTDKWRPVYLRREAALLSKSDCQVELRDGDVHAARRYRGNRGTHFVIITEQEME